MEILNLWHHAFEFGGDAYALFRDRANADAYVDANPGSEVISLMVVDGDA